MPPTLQFSTAASPPEGRALCSVLERMRPTLAVLVLLAAPVAFAQADARMRFLARQLSSAKDPRVRAQTAVVLGASEDPAAVPPLCGALKDPEPVVRSAAAKALGDLQLSSALACLQKSRGEANSDVRLAIAKAIEQLERPAAGPSLYVAIAPVVDKSGALSSDALRMAEELLRARLSKLGAIFAPPGESKASAQALIRARKLRGWMVRMQFQPHAGNGLKVNLLCLTYPEQALKGDYAVKASGGKAVDLIRAMVPRVVEDAAEDLEWRARR